MKETNYAFWVSLIGLFVAPSIMYSAGVCYDAIIIATIMFIAFAIISLICFAKEEVEKDEPA